MLRNLTIERYLCFHKHRRTNHNAYLNIYSRKSFFLLKGNSAIWFSYRNDISEKDLERNEVSITSLMKVFLGNECNCYIHTARNAKLTSTRIVFEKTIMKRKVFRGVFRTHSNIYDEAFKRK